jgi:hypothetical protein
MPDALPGSGVAASLESDAAKCMDGTARDGVTERTTWISSDLLRSAGIGSKSMRV